MIRYFWFVIVVLLSIDISGQTEKSTTPQSIPAISQKTDDMQKYPGYFNFYREKKAGTIWLEIDKWDTEFLYLISLPAGVGSNDIGLDRGQLGNRRVVKFQRIGPKVLLIQPNYSYRALSSNPAEELAVEEAFAQSVLWGFEVAAEDSGKVLVDASSFFLRDAHNVIGRLKNTGQGDYQLDASRSAFYWPRSKNFPLNTEVEVLLTFTGENPGNYVQQVVPTPRALTVRQHHSFIQLPDENYRPRKFDPRAGFFGISYYDYAAHIHEPLKKRFIARHRLEKKDPAAAVSEAVKPIVYYVDPAAPEPIRSALIEGAQWWNQAFEAAGYKDAFRVELLPENADPLDVRYNVIQWVHRSTRGWSYGDAVMDPRSGEIIKGHITLGSLRVRQDYLIAEGLLAPYEEGKPVSAEMQEMALARLRQLAAHEVGHTLGLAHNFAASVNNRASVMDYPHPLVKIKDDGTLDLSDAYAVGIGEWDKVTIQYGYQDFPESETEGEGLNKILQDSFSRGLILISDQDARPAGGAHSLAHLWDNGTDAAGELLRVMKVRKIALDRFSENNIPMGTPMAALEEALVPIYFFHRYQLEAASKFLGGIYYTYALRGDGQKVSELITPEEQRRALSALLQTLQPGALVLPEKLLEVIPPRAYGMGRSRELLNIRTGVTFDPLAAAEASASMTVGLLLHPERAARLIEYHARDRNYPDLGEVIDQLLNSTFRKETLPGYEGEIRRTVNMVVLYHLMQLAADEKTSSQVKAIAFFKLDELNRWLSKKMKKVKDENQRAHYRFAVARIEKFLKDPGKITLPQPSQPPAGAPIGSAAPNGFGCKIGEGIYPR